MDYSAGKGMTEKIKRLEQCVSNKGDFKAKEGGTNVYLAGPIKNNNYSMFNDYATILRVLGVTVVCPLLQEVHEGRFAGTSSELFMENRLSELPKCNIMAMLPGWDRSISALEEYQRASSLGIPIVALPMINTEESLEKLMDKFPVYSLGGHLETGLRIARMIDRDFVTKTRSEWDDILIKEWITFMGEFYEGCKQGEPQECTQGKEKHIISQEELINHISKLCEKELEIINKKNKDYSSQDEDALRNFKLVETLGITSVTQGLLVRITDKYIRMVNLLTREEAPAVDETVEDTISDMRNYLGILSAYLHSQKV